MLREQPKNKWTLTFGKDVDGQSEKKEEKVGNDRQSLNQDK